MKRLVDRAVCRILKHRWAYRCIGLQRGCERCGRWELRDVLRGGWVKVPVRLPRPPRGSALQGPKA